MPNKDTIIVIRGTVDWAKVTGKARPYTGNPKYDKGPSWSVDITPDAKSRKLLKEVGVDSKLKQPKENDKRSETFMTLRILENKADGEKNLPPKVKDVRDQPWDGRLIGNGSVCDIKVKVKDYGSGSEKGTYFQAMRVLDLVEYESDDFGALDEDDEYFAAGSEDAADTTKASKTSPNPDDLDDEIPF